MRIGIVCPYSLDVAGGVQRHVLDLAAALRGLGHTVEVLAPATGTAPEFVTPRRTGRRRPLQRLRRPRRVRPDDPPPHPALARHARLRRAARARADDPVGVGAGAARRPAGRSSRPSTPPPSGPGRSRRSDPWRGPCWNG
ncbi:glycosyltransferase [Pseudonocardia sp. ICBG601]|uniref:glycosyltransferase n=1 Tax=Pseudonocardia sp. ICBG601 TaxID=2846759 RepID=UPI0035ABEEBB